MNNDYFGIIYKIFCTVNNKSYIGQTIRTLKERINGHIYASHKEITLNDSILKRSFKKYTPEKFSYEILEYCYSQEELDEMEFHYIKQYHSHFRDGWGYNMNYGGAGGGGHRRRFNLTEDHKRKIGDANRGEKNGMHKSNGRINNFKGKFGILAPGWGKVGEKSKCSLSYIIYTPKNEILLITGMGKFCRENDLNKGAMCHNGKKHNNIKHKGYRAYLIDLKFIFNIWENIL